jgi:hypothetical protein
MGLFEKYKMAVRGQNMVDTGCGRKDCLGLGYCSDG